MGLNQSIDEPQKAGIIKNANNLLENTNQIVDSSKNLVKKADDLMGDAKKKFIDNSEPLKLDVTINGLGNRHALIFLSLFGLFCFIGLIICLVGWVTCKNKSNYKNMSKSTIILLYSDNCGHCKQFKPVWNKVKNENKNNIFIEYDIQNHGQLYQQFLQKVPENQRGVPLILKTKSIYSPDLINQIEFENFDEYPRTETNFKNFINK